jgi:hypothetical protein
MIWLALDPEPELPPERICMSIWRSAEALDPPLLDPVPVPVLVPVEPAVEPLVEPPVEPWVEPPVEPWVEPPNPPPPIPPPTLPPVPMLPPLVLPPVEPVEVELPVEPVFGWLDPLDPPPPQPERARAPIVRAALSCFFFVMSSGLSSGWLPKRTCRRGGITHEVYQRSSCCIWCYSKCLRNQVQLAVVEG